MFKACKWLRLFKKKKKTKWKTTNLNENNDHGRFSILFFVCKCKSKIQQNTNSESKVKWMYSTDILFYLLHSFRCTERLNCCGFNVLKKVSCGVSNNQNIAWFCICNKLQLKRQTRSLKVVTMTKYRMRSQARWIKAIDNAHRPCLLNAHITIKKTIELIFSAIVNFPHCR